ncbi:MULTISPECIES: GTPase Era [unclassified Imperialibacter]|uniref:GTPase Era n=1 Tax=unclassified Imperialibacter TaxID=2629706 RepID=UPI00125AD55A|nr:MULTISPECIES: GTPase Era [unclassified Imperialibacter]CAD5246088.1 GTPase Era [Imperialibacter sp. 75]CAD5246110.1 GTPase Era [Imperialibacter sp. 89]VVS95971.1 GTPase Era [Imperialibacter sp. EC-SDR9]
MSKKSTEPPSKEFRSGFVSIIGKPNVGKSTLMNALIGERLSIITAKAQTTRHRIFGILTGKDFQIVYSDTPGVMKPQYELQEAMMRFVYQSLEDADMILFVVELGDKMDGDNVEILELLRKSGVPALFVINKIDKSKGSQLEDKVTYFKEFSGDIPILCISALDKTNLEPLFDQILEKLPVHPPYFPDDEMTDRTERFFASEIIREKIFLNYKKEVPYSCEVIIASFKEEEKIIRVMAEIFVERATQRAIIIGHGGLALKKVGIEARKDMEAFFGKQVHLETYVRVEKDWRQNKLKLKRFGYVD